MPLSPKVRAPSADNARPSPWEGVLLVPFSATQARRPGHHKAPGHLSRTSPSQGSGAVTSALRWMYPAHLIAHHLLCAWTLTKKSEPFVAAVPTRRHQTKRRSVCCIQPSPVAPPNQQVLPGRPDPRLRPRVNAPGFKPPLSLSASQPLSLSASQPLSLSASQPLSLSASQPLSLSASQKNYVKR